MNREVNKMEKAFPDQRNGETLEQYIIRSWKSDAEIRNEFMDDVSTYKAYCKAMAAGQVRILGK